MRRTVWRSDSISAAVALALAPFLIKPLAAEAQDTEGPLQEVTVTAQKREQNLQDVALSVSALTGEDLALKGAEGFRDWAQYVPGVTMYQGTSANRRAGPTAVIRGVSQTGGGQLNEVSTMATTTFMLGQLPMFSGDPGLFDINRIEVLRGPQGTLFGIASMGGTIRFIPNEARLDQFDAQVGLGTGFIRDGGNTYDVDAMVNIPLIENTLALRLAGVHRKSDGYIDMFKLPLTANNPNEIFVDGKEFDPRLRDGSDIIRDANGTEASGARVSVKYAPNDRLEIDAWAMWQKSDQEMKQVIDYNDQSREWVVSRFALEPQRDEFAATSLELSYDVGFGSIEYVGGFFNSSMSETIDVTTLVTTFLNGTGANSSVHALDWDGPGGLPMDPWPSPTQFPFESDTDITTHELRLQGTDQPLFGLRFDYVLGVFYMDEKRHGTFRVANPTWNANRGPNTVPILTEGGLITGQEGGGGFDTKAVFADLMLHLTDHLSIGVGARYSDSERDSALFGWGDAGHGRAANGATEGDDLSAPGTPSQVGGIRDTGVTPRYTIKYQFDDERMLFATVAKGQRMPGGFPNPNFWNNPASPGSAVNNPVCQNLAQTLGVYDDAVNGAKTDEVWSYDLGLKSTWLDRRLQINTSLYYLDWKDLQRNVQFSQFEAQCNILVPANVGAVEVKGFELEMIYAPVDSVTLNAAIGYTDAQVAETVPGVNDSLGQQLEKGDSIENVAPWTISAGAEFRFGLGTLGELLGGDTSGFARVDWRFIDERLGTNVGDEASLKADPIRSQFIAEAYNLTDVRFGIENGGWSGSLYVANVFNERAMFESFRQTWLPNQRVVSASRPRTIGVTVRKRF